MNWYFKNYTYIRIFCLTNNFVSVNEAKHLKTTILKWAKADILVKTLKISDLELSVKINEQGNFEAQVECFVPHCKLKNVKLVKQGTHAWTTSNYYKHVKRHLEIDESTLDERSGLKSFLSLGNKRLNSDPDGANIPAKKNNKTGDDSIDLTRSTDKTSSAGCSNQSVRSCSTEDQLLSSAFKDPF